MDPWTLDPLIRYIETNLHIATALVLNLDLAFHLIAEDDSRAVIWSQVDMSVASLEVAVLDGEAPAVGFDGWQVLFRVIPLYEIALDKAD